MMYWETDMFAGDHDIDQIKKIVICFFGFRWRKWRHSVSKHSAIVSLKIDNDVSGEIPLGQHIYRPHPLQWIIDMFAHCGSLPGVEQGGSKDWYVSNIIHIHVVVVIVVVVIVVYWVFSERFRVLLQLMILAEKKKKVHVQKVAYFKIEWGCWLWKSKFTKICKLKKNLFANLRSPNDYGLIISIKANKKAYVCVCFIFEIGGATSTWIYFPISVHTLK